jgi:T3SS (YopN, CesT) and YbjN peptide-binding chaperone 1
MTSSGVQAEFEGAKKLVEEVIASLGLDPAAVRSRDTEGLASWGIKRGSAAILVTVFKSDRGDAAFLRAISPVMTLPESERRPDLYRRLLELNGQGLVNAAFGIIGERIVVKSERPASWLEAAEVEQIITQLSAVADTYDDRLVREFGGERASDLSA